MAKIKIGDELQQLEKELEVAFEKKNSWGKNEAIVEIKRIIKQRSYDIVDRLMNEG